MLFRSRLSRKRICPAVAAAAYAPIYAPWAPSTRRMCRRSGASASSAAPASRAVPPGRNSSTMRGIFTTSMSWRRSMPARRRTKCSIYNWVHKNRPPVVGAGFYVQYYENYNLSISISECISFASSIASFKTEIRSLPSLVTK